MSRSALKGIQAAAGAGGGVLYVEDVFSTYLWEGDGSEETVTNNIDLDGEEGLVWTKKRSTTGYHELFYKNSGSPADGTSRLSSNLTSAENNGYTGNLAVDFLSDGFSFGSTLNTSGTTFASWTFRKAPKFFDIVTWTGNSTAGRTVSHNLGSVPGMIIIKCTNSSAEPWYVYHRETDSSAPEDYHLNLNASNARSDSDEMLNDTAPTSTEFTVSQFNSVNGSGNTYVAYLFAHNNSDGDYGENSDQDIIKCGSYTGNGSSSGPTIDLGFEPQFVIIKAATNYTSGNWLMLDTMRGWTANSGNQTGLYANLSDAEIAANSGLSPTATGFQIKDTTPQINGSGNTYIYVAIRRPNKPASEFAGTDLFKVDNGQSSSPAFTAGFPPDFALFRDTGGDDFKAVTRLLGDNYLITASTAAVASNSLYNFTTFQDSWLDFAFNSSWYSWMFRRAPGYFDVVAYTGTGSNRTINHNLGVAPEMMIIKSRESLYPYTAGWAVYHSAISPADSIYLSQNGSSSGASFQFASTAPTNSVFTLGSAVDVNMSGKDFISYHFASVDGISKVGSYTGTGADLNVDCGFSAGARFVLIKRTDSNGDWYVWDSERGIVAGNDPYLLLNSSAAEVTSTDYIDPLSSGFTVTSSAPAALNNSGGTYIFLAIA
tara:strand:+ start:261 stop:2228 length:1968 start_codon:yes stop_codon:yes gene_type:complete